VRTVPTADLQRALDEMETSLDVCTDVPALRTRERVSWLLAHGGLHMPGRFRCEISEAVW
jgi:hypothetical protein